MLLLGSRLYLCGGTPSPLRAMAAAALPSVFINHGGGPCFFMPDDGSGMFPANTWRKMGAHLSNFFAKLPGEHAPPVKAILVASAHWETSGGPAVTVAANPPLLYDYYGFPPHTYEIEWPAPGDPALASRVRSLLADAGFDRVHEEASRGFDHGVFIPLKLAFPDASIPVVQLSPALVAWEGYETDLADDLAFRDTPGYRAYLARFAAWLAKGPALARVTGVVASELAWLGEEPGFDIRH